MPDRPTVTFPAAVIRCPVFVGGQNASAFAGLVQRTLVAAGRGVYLRPTSRLEPDHRHRVVQDSVILLLQYPAVRKHVKVRSQRIRCVLARRRAARYGAARRFHAGALSYALHCTAAMCGAPRIDATHRDAPRRIGSGVKQPLNLGYHTLVKSTYIDLRMFTRNTSVFLL